VKSNRILSFALVAIFSSAGFAACSSSSSSAADGDGGDSGQDATASDGGAATDGGVSSADGSTSDSGFWLEPRTTTTIGVGQYISVFAATEEAGAPYPTYLDPTAVTWSLSSSIAGDRAGTSGEYLAATAVGDVTVTGKYQSVSAQVSVHVSGNMIAKTLTVTGQGTRNYDLYVPDFGTSTGPHPLILAMHGGGGSPMNMAASSDLNTLAQQHNAYVAYLQGTGTQTTLTFNAGSCCGYAQTHNVDDVSYAQAVLADVQSGYAVDATKVFAVGFSNGAIMTHRLACAMANQLAGIMAVSGGSGEFDDNLTQYYTCAPARPIPILETHATNDRNYPIDGGVGGGESGASFYPIPSTISDWIARNNVTTAVTVEIVTPTTSCFHYATAADSSKPSAPVTFCEINPVDVYDAADQVVFGGGHSWPGGVRSDSAKSDVPVTDFSADDYMWSYFKL
jgi:polyhydroxybutyrate depolymerase